MKMSQIKAITEPTASNLLLIPVRGSKILVLVSTNIGLLKHKLYRFNKKNKIENYKACISGF